MVNLLLGLKLCMWGIVSIVIGIVTRFELTNLIVGKPKECHVTEGQPRAKKQVSI